MDPHERATSVWYRVAGLLRRREIAIEIIEAEIRLAQREVLLDAAQLVSSLDPIQAARELRSRAARLIRAE
jgi:glutamine synthetase